mmetsp:Transcript_25557/g.40953  ORF Transcript_25557/g.40953 Transcript_25557/m.40953 type:complete len:310 (-) Transcript_25557:63-992(-)|eukprot:CAMPEP_0169068568 /NCGR_PEP_ID=MMETSP1015-20121227/4087_1 /TAXON_ID=342587 /ORGANISM="Karlodinium micrum, Strain CCMP2283" /LENGTH=309 /DNA_ID=CAMNT_0009127379 /DNA_START=170 /DNA_END=1099 /DNA_ORIENTATION=+
MAQDCRVVLLSPFDIHFSQTRLRNEFQDGHTVDETTRLIQTVPRGTRRTLAEGGSGAADANTTEAKEGEQEEADEEDILGEGCEDLSAVTRGEEFKLQSFPFPRIEVTKWRCKLREPDGSPKIDPSTGLELYSHEERWFTFDNRRLYCLQKAATAVWPTEVRCEVIEVPHNMAKCRELRKFDTRTFGCTVLVGRRDDTNIDTWSWRAAVGLPEELQPEEGVARQKSMRWRGRGGRGGPHSGGRGHRRGQFTEEEEKGPVGLELMRSALLFFLVYLGLRVVVSVFRHRYQAASTSATISPPVDMSGGPPI